jgi:phage protein D
MSGQGTVLRPRGFVKLNGQSVPVLDFHTVENSHFQADTFEFTLAASDPAFGLSFWADTGEVMIDLQLGFLQAGERVNAMPGDLASLLVGTVDDVDADTVPSLITLTGRDLTGRLIDNKISKSWPDRTASEIVTDLAGQFGLSPQVTSTKVAVGKYGKGQYNAQGRETPVWDLITGLADQEGFDAYVKGSTLYFGPPEADDGDPLALEIQELGPPLRGNFERLRLRRSLTLAKDITVTVISYSTAKKVPIKAVAKRQGAQKSASTSFRTGKTSQNYTIRKPGLTQQQAQDLAQKTLAELSRHERTFSCELPADTATRSRTKATISGSGTGWDTSYFIDTVTRSFTGDSLTMQITGKNHEIESDPG